MLPAGVISTVGLTKTYGSLRALDNLTIGIPEDSIYGFIGPNGAGKSTTLGILATLLSPTSGVARVCGFDPVSEPYEVRKLMGYMPDVMGVYDQLRVGEYLEFHAAAYKIPRDQWSELVAGLLALVDLDVKRQARVNELSRGMKQRLSLARALVHDPKVLLLDEPASGLDPRARIEFRGLLQQLRKLGKTVLVSSHVLSELQQMCDGIAVIEAGQLLAAGAPDEIIGKLEGGRTVKVRFTNGEVREYGVADDEAQAQLLRQLIAAGEPVLEFIEQSADFENLFLRITQGIVQ